VGVAVTGSIPARVFEHKRIWQLDQAAFEAAAALIANAERPHQPELVVGIDRGGRDLATALSAHLSVPAVMIRARHNLSDEIALPAAGTVEVDLSPLDDRQAPARLLIADDIAGSGQTLAVASGLLAARFGAARIRTAVLCRNAGSTQAPGTWIWDVADWVAFPWEPPPAAPIEPLPFPEFARHP
jgi:hypoxanthine phosphoribosyltransferase